jgi:hypothetical protein
MTNMKSRIITSPFVAAVFVVSACSHKKDVEPKVEVATPTTQTANARSDAYFTWTNYDGRKKDLSRVMFVWNGENVGEGRKGFQEILNRLGNLPERSTVLEYPSYVAGNDGSPYYKWPYEYDALTRTLKARRLVLLISCYDHEGKYVGATKYSKRVDYATEDY